MAARVSTKLSIPHPNEPGCNLVGILEQLSQMEPTQGRKIALILHGTLGHKDYLFQKRLAARIPVDSFRFDFRGSYESGGTWKQGALHEDIEDLQAVVDYLKVNYGYVVDLLVGHSRGSIMAFRWLATSEDGRKVSAFVNVSGRYRMEKLLETAQYKIWHESFAKQGYHEWDAVVARQVVRAKVTPEDVKTFTTWDPTFVWDQFAQHTDVLTVHGLQDQVVPPYDALIYAQALGNRSPGTHTLHFIERGDHNFTGIPDEVVDAILRWWNSRNNGELKTGISVDLPSGSCKL
ncbi:ectomycorrhiza-regulated esterase [Coprinellus micaceus]|uniref:Ectomycorrhiza-regulated esterase n=1 Tax=Coprinellus micaceus TaxID=71717 RepID=A0A4Y7SLN8_COPMI|nr:ectomycorrhiza-regulated esterase [Coprinellus micaceus]